MTRSSSQYHAYSINQWLLNHLRAFVFSLGELCKTPIATLLTLAVIGVTMALPSGLYQLLNNFETINSNLNTNSSLSLYLKENISKSDLADLIAHIQNNSHIQTVKYISPAQGLDQFKKFTKLNDVLSQFKQNPLPGVLIVKPNKDMYNPKKLAQLLGQLKQLPQVEVGQLDTTWAKRLFYLITLGQRITYALATLFSLAVIIVIGNTIRLSMQQHQKEIAIMQIFGATPGFIRRPLLYRGVLYGCLGGLLAWLIIYIILSWLSYPAEALMDTYNKAMILNNFNFMSGAYTVLLSSILGFIGSWLAMRPYLKNNEYKY